MSSLLSCYGGKDSDVTDDIQQVTAINGIATDGSYTLYQGDTLRINPSLTFSEGADSLRYDYRWVVGKQQEIATGKQLVWEVSLPSGYNMATDIPGVFIAKTGKRTGVSQDILLPGAEHIHTVLHCGLSEV